MLVRRVLGTRHVIPKGGNHGIGHAFAARLAPRHGPDTVEQQALADWEDRAARSLVRSILPDLGIRGIGIGDTRRARIELLGVRHTGGFLLRHCH